MSARFIIAMSLLFTFGVTSLLWAVANSRFTTAPTWHPVIHVDHLVSWQQCWNYRNVCHPSATGHCENVLESMDCEHGGPTVYVDDVPYPTPTREVVK